jgi:hypothetical protein
MFVPLWVEELALMMIDHCVRHMTTGKIFITVLLAKKTMSGFILY